MAAKPQKGNETKKRKRLSGSKGDGEKLNPKKLKSPSIPKSKGAKKSFKPSKKLSKPLEEGKISKSNMALEEKQQQNKREARLRAKELAEARKKKRKRHYTLEQELASLWEKMRIRDISQEDRSRLVSEALEKMKGKIPEIASSHVSSRILQTCVKYSSQAEREGVFKELQPHFLTLACSTYAVHVVKKMLDNASKGQLAEFISSLHGHVASLLRHMVGSVVVEHAYDLGNAAQKRALLMELYSTELQLFKDLVLMSESRLADIILKLRLQKASVLRHMTSVLQPILEKGIVDHTIIHRALMEFFTIADQSSAADVIQQLSGPLLVRMMHSKDGFRICILCIKHGNAKERKKIIKGMNGHITKIAHDKFASMVLVCIFSVVDDTKLLSKIVVRELKASLRELVLDKNARRPLLQLLHPNCSRYFSPDDLALLNLSVPSLCTKDDVDKNCSLNEHTCSSKFGPHDEEDKSNAEDIAVEASMLTKAGESLHPNEGGKKDPFLRRKELLIDSGLAESLIDTCKEMAGELLRSPFGKDILYEVATGGAGSILCSTLGDKLDSLHEAIASLLSQPSLEEEEHLLENFHSSRTIRRLVLDCPKFASTFWERALKGNCEMWAQGHSSKVVSTFCESSDPAVRDLAMQELQPLIDVGVLKLPPAHQVASRLT